MIKLKDIKKYEEYIIEKRRDFHMHPETGFKEFRTSKIIEAELRTMGFTLVTGVGVTGIVATLKGPIEGKTVLLRADIDALSMQEENDVVYKSQNDGVMHSCGHDTHTSMLLGACKFFSDNKNILEGTLKVVFQSAEEGPMPGGGSFVVNEGHLDDVDAVFALHITTSDTCGRISIKPGPAMAAPDEFRVVIKGSGTHASAPHTGNDVILTASKVITSLQSIISRNVSPNDSAVISVCTINSGTAFNILPDKAVFNGTIRTLKPETRKFIFKRMEELVSGISRLNGCDGILEIIEAYPPLINDIKESEFVIENAFKTVNSLKMQLERMQFVEELNVENIQNIIVPALRSYEEYKGIFVLMKTEDDTLNPYWFWENGEIKKELVGKYQSLEYFMVVEDKDRCIIKPEFYKVNGEQILLTILMVPIKKDGDVVGVVGIDLSMSFFQSLIEKLKTTKEMEISIITNDGFLFSFILVKMSFNAANSFSLFTIGK